MPAADDHYHFRTIWISDIHLGTPGCQAYYLLDFLRTHRANTLYLVGDILDGWQRGLNAIRQHLGLPYWSMSQYLKHKVKNAVSFISDFEHVMTEQARRRGCDGVVCGHIHKAQMREINGILYCNDGDWVESLTALAEDFDGKLQLIHWQDRLSEPMNLGRIADELPATNSVPA